MIRLGNQVIDLTILQVLQHEDDKIVLCGCHKDQYIDIVAINQWTYFNETNSVTYKLVQLK